MKAPSVKLRKITGRDNWQAYYKHPRTGKQITRSTGTTRRRDAERFAGKWQAELSESDFRERREFSWEDGVTEYESHLRTIGETTARDYRLWLTRFEKIVQPTTLNEISNADVEKFKLTIARTMRKVSVNTALTAVKAFLKYCERTDMIDKVPHFQKFKNASKSKGRPLSLAEFQQMIEAVPHVRPEDSDKWQRALTAFVLTGLRLTEGIKLSWDADAQIRLVLQGGEGFIQFVHGAQKAKRAEIVPLIPAAVAFFSQWPAEQRSGSVLELFAQHASSRIFADIGKQAAVIVDQSTGKYASCHDLRRTFAQWLVSAGVSPYDLGVLMRHKDIATTMKYYSSHNASATGARVASLLGAPKSETFVKHGPAAEVAEPANSPQIPAFIENAPLAQLAEQLTLNQ